MEKEERAFRRIITETALSGPEPLTGREIHDVLGVGRKMVTAARRSLKEEARQKEEAQCKGRPRKSRAISAALKRNCRTSKSNDRRTLVNNFYIENSTPTSRKRDVVFKGK